MRIKFWKSQSKQEILDASLKQLSKEEAKANKAKAKKVYTPRFYMMILSGLVFAGGVALFVIYFNTLNIVFGLPGIIMVVGGAFALHHFWSKGGSISVDYLDGMKRKETVNSLCLYPDKVVFENVYEPKGFPWSGAGLRGKYFVNIWDTTLNELVPFVLPDQQYCDPIVFAQRVLGLPAHRKIFERKPKLLQRLKTALLVLAIGIVWLLIMTTTGG